MKLASGLNFGCVVAALFLAFGLVAGDASAQNLLVNPGFEDGNLTGWVLAGESGSSSVSVVADNGPTEIGTNAAFLDNQAEAVGLTMKQTTAPGSGGDGTVYYSFDLKLGQAALGGVFFVEIFAEQIGVGIVGGSGLLGNYAPADWTNFSGQFEAPVGTDFFTIQFTAVTGATVGSTSTMYVDNVDLNQGGSVPTGTKSVGTLKAIHN
jgi:hypothetical protein